jgi:coenzyme F420-reducing hydrogenase delta subunit/Pyruvate/2-oxoacid:ferredoxin oxidoreductase delta subunit
MLHSNQLDPTFTQEVLAEPGGQNLFLCYSCGTCMSTCLVKRYNSEFNPRKLLRMATLGMRAEAIANPTHWLCSACDACYTRCPQGIHISEVMRAIRNVAVRSGATNPFPTAVVDPEKCSSCSICPKSCPYQAISMVQKMENGRERKVAHVDATLCMSCGICTAACPSLAITLEDFNLETVLARLGGGGWLDTPVSDPKLAVFMCNWCLRADEDVAALDDLPPNVRVVNVPCSGRVDPLLILVALNEGADGVLVAGCTGGECHYKQGNMIEKGRVALLNSALGSAGLPKGKVRFEQFGAADRGKFTQVVERMVGALAGGAE